MYLTVTYGIEYTGMEGLTVGYAQGDVEATTNSKAIKAQCMLSTQLEL